MSHICIWVLENQHRLWRNMLGQDWKFFDVSGTPTPHPLLILPEFYHGAWKIPRAVQPDLVYEYLAAASLFRLERHVLCGLPRWWTLWPWVVKVNPKNMKCISWFPLGRCCRNKSIRMDMLSCTWQASVTKSSMHKPRVRSFWWSAWQTQRPASRTKCMQQRACWKNAHAWSAMAIRIIKLFAPDPKRIRKADTVSSPACSV